MKKILFAVVATVVMAGAFAVTAKAESYTATGIVTDAQPQYSTVSKRIPQQVCNTVDVPIYGNNGSQGSSVFGLDLEGAIIGGVIGNNVTKNVENGGAAGAILGGLLGSQNTRNNQQIIGYRPEQQCSTSYTVQQENVFVGTRVVVDVNGMKVSGSSAQQLQVGDSVTVQVDVRLR